MKNTHFNRIKKSMLNEQRIPENIEEDVREYIDYMVKTMMEECTDMIYENDFIKEFEGMGYDDKDARSLSKVAYDVCMELVERMKDEMVIRKLLDRSLKNYFR